MKLVPNKLGIKSALSPQETAMLQKLAKGKLVVEVGSLLGYSTIQMARVARRVLAVDPHNGYPYYQPTPTLQEFLRNIERWNVAGLVTPIVDKAQNVLPSLVAAGLTFIDTTGFYKDTMYCLEHAKSPVIACHDFDRGGCQVTQAVLDFVRKTHRSLHVVDTLAVIT